jgi:hypothetical protein
MVITYPTQASDGAAVDNFFIIFSVMRFGPMPDVLSI